MIDKKQEVFLETDRIILRSLKESDFSQTMVDWINSKEVTKFLARGIVPATIESTKEEYLRTSKDSNEIQLAIVEKASGNYIGITGLHSLNWIARHGEFRVLIGDISTWGKGLGTEAAQLMVAFGFQLLNLNKVWLGVNKENARAANSYLKAGFKVEGELREELYRNGRYYAITRMSILRKEFNRVKEQWPTHDFIANQMAGKQE